MDFKPQPEGRSLRERVLDFMDEQIYPQERELMEALDARSSPGVPTRRNLSRSAEKARATGLWNLFMPDERFGPGLKNWEYGLLCEEMGRSPMAAPMAFNCAAPGHRQHGDPRRARHRRAAASAGSEPLLEGRSAPASR
jgi:acyl-CoA dehydrogenase